MITNNDVKDFFLNKRDVDCKITNELIRGGYQQESYGYIDIARACELDNPSQWWHLMNYLLLKEEQHRENEEFCNLIVCGELIFWMAEVSNAVSKKELLMLKNRIINSNDIKKRSKWNMEIKNLCWDKIMNQISKNKI